MGAADVFPALGPNGEFDYKKLRMDANERLITTAQFVGLEDGILASALTITDVAKKVPLLALTGRNGMSIRVLGANTVYFGHSGVTSADGFPFFQYEILSVDISNNAAVELYAICEAGKSSEVRIFEVG